MKILVFLLIACQFFYFAGEGKWGQLYFSAKMGAVSIFPTFFSQGKIETAPFLTPEKIELTPFFPAALAPRSQTVLPSKEEQRDMSQFFPYDREAVRAILYDPTLTEREKRTGVYQKIRTYDRSVEEERTSGLVERARQKGQIIVTGRNSRAFRNQGFGFADARLLLDPSPLYQFAHQEIVRFRVAFESLGLGDERILPKLLDLENILSRREWIPEAQVRAAIERLLIGIRDISDFHQKRIDQLLVNRDPNYRQERRQWSGRKGGKVTLNRLHWIMERLLKKVDKAPKQDAAFVFLIQRPSVTGAIQIARLMEGEEVDPGKSDELRELGKRGQRNATVSPSQQVLEYADFHIEALPLSLRVEVDRDGKPSFKVSQEEFQQAIIEMGPYWAKNLRSVMDSETVSLARQHLIRESDSLRREAGGIKGANPNWDEEKTALEIIIRHPELKDRVIERACLIEGFFRGNASQIKDIQAESGLTRYEALAALLNEPGCLEGALPVQNNERWNGRFSNWVAQPRRELPSWIIMTTEAPGMSESYIRPWLEDSMAVANLCEDHPELTSKIKEKMDGYRQTILALSEKVIAELGLGDALEDLELRGGVGHQEAVGILWQMYLAIRDEVAKLGALMQKFPQDYQPQPGAEIREVEDYIEAHRDQLEEECLLDVAKKNHLVANLEEALKQDRGLALQQIREQIARAREANNTDLADDLDGFLRVRARSAVIRENNLKSEVEQYLQRYQQSASATAAREAIREAGLMAELDSSLYRFEATGGMKRYNLLYAPSRVDLGPLELTSVTKWAQILGGSDSRALQAGRRLFELFNERVVGLGSTQVAEMYKTMENGLRALHLADSDVMNLIVQHYQEGDFTQFIEEMNRRGDRVVLHGGEGYGGYCVWKDGLFLTMVYFLTKEKFLEQHGIPEESRARIINTAYHVLAERARFENKDDWVEWGNQELNKIEAIRGLLNSFGEVLRLAEGLEQLGWPISLDPEVLPISWIATYESEKRIIGAAQLIRMTTILKVWQFEQTRRKVAASNADKPTSGPNQVRVALFGEYKANTADARDATGTQMAEIWMGNRAHLLAPLDPTQKAYARLLLQGLDPHKETIEIRIREMLGRSLARDKVTENEPRVIEAAYSLPSVDEFVAACHQILTQAGIQGEALDAAIRELEGFYKAEIIPHKDLLGKFNAVIGLIIQPEDRVAFLDNLDKDYQAIPPPGEIRWLSAMGLPSEDILGYMKDTPLGRQAEEAREVLVGIGLDEDRIIANLKSYGTDIGRWVLPKRMSDEDLASLKEKIGIAIHPLRLMLLGPMELEFGIQGIDYLNVGIPHKGLLKLLENAPYLRDLMREAYPRSALIIGDGAAGTRPPSMNKLDVQFWFAAAGQVGREAGYFNMQIGPRTIDEWRKEMKVRKALARELLEKLAEGRDGEAGVLYQRLVGQMRNEEWATVALREVERLIGINRLKKRDQIVAEAFCRLQQGLPFERLDFATWLAMGGMFLLDGLALEEQQQVASVFREFRNRHQSAQAEGIFEGLAWSEERSQELASELIHPQAPRRRMELKELKGRQTSSKLVEEVALRAIETRQALRIKEERTRSLVQQLNVLCLRANEIQGWGFEQARDAAISILRENEHPAQIDDAQYGRFLAYARQAFSALTKDLEQDGIDVGEIERHFEDLIPVVNTLGEREGLVDFRLWKRMSGSYESIGDFGFLGQEIRKRGDRAALEKLADAIGLFDALHFLEGTLVYTRIPLADLSTRSLWRKLTESFADTIYDHFYEYKPTQFEHGIGFEGYKGEELYRLAWGCHKELYRYLRDLILTRTEARNLSEEEQDLLLGNCLDEENPFVAIGAQGAGRYEQLWRGYNQLREVSFNVTHDGLALLNPTYEEGGIFPEIFSEFDPALIHVDSRINTVILFPVGRPHVAFMEAEAPVTNDELLKAGRNGGNVLVTRAGYFAATPGARQPDKRDFYITDGYLYLSREAYIQALIRHKGYTEEEARRRADERVGPKGVRAAVRFSRPVMADVLIPFHHHPAYESGEMEENGYRGFVQTLFHTWTTYDKAKNPDIFGEALLPHEIDFFRHEEDGRIFLLRGAGEREGAISMLDSPEEARGFIREWLTMAADYLGARVMLKAAAESGGRKQKRQELRNEAGALDPALLEEAVEFSYDILLKQNLAIQEALLAFPELWATQEALENFRRRQILDWKRPVVFEGRSPTTIYSSHRIILSYDPVRDEWHTSHPIVLMSQELITNIGRGGTLEIFEREMIQPEHQERILARLKEAGEQAMECLKNYETKEHRDGETIGDYYRLETGREVGHDLSGRSYGEPFYMMLDFLVMPIFDQPGEIHHLEPIYDQNGKRTGFRIWLTNEGRIFEGRIVDWRAVLIEPNTGIGLHDRFWLRELAKVRGERELAELTLNDWEQVGEDERIILRDMMATGEERRRARFGALTEPEAPVSSEPDAPRGWALQRERATNGENLTGAIQETGEELSQNPLMSLRAERSNPFFEIASGASRLRNDGGTDFSNSLNLSEVLVNWLVASVTGGPGQREKLHLELQGDANKISQMKGQITSLLDRASKWLAGELSKKFNVPEDEVLAFCKGLAKERVVELALERLLSERLAPPILLQREKKTVAELKGMLGKDLLHWIIFEAPLAQHDFYPLIVDALSSGWEVVAVRSDWLDEYGNPTRVIYRDPITCALNEVSLAEPFPFGGNDRVQYLAISAAEEKGIRERLDSRGVRQINSSGSVEAADSKWDTFLFLSSQKVNTPRAWKLSRYLDEAGIVAELKRIASAIGPIVVQPNRGTEGRDVEGFFLGLSGSNEVLIRHIQKIQQYDDVLIRQLRGDVRFSEDGTGIGRAVDLRVIVVRDERGYHAESGYLQVAGDGDSIVSSKGRGGEIRPIRDAEGHLWELWHQVQGNRLSEEPVSWEQAKGAAIEEAVWAAEALRLDFAGVDVKFAVEDGNIIPLILDVNPRSSGLSYSSPLSERQYLVTDSLWGRPSPPVEESVEIIQQQL